MELTKGMQMAVSSVLKMLMPPDVLKVITPERTDKLLTDAEAMVLEVRSANKTMLENQENIRLTLEATQHDLASLNARFPVLNEDDIGSKQRPRKRNGIGDASAVGKFGDLD